MSEEIVLKKEYLVEKYNNKHELPKKIRLEVCSVCQLNCASCYMRLSPEKVERGCGFGMLSFENFKKIVDDNNFEKIEISNSGEIFLNPELVDMIKYAYSKGINLTANNGVNLNKLTDEQAEALVKYEFKSLIVSIDGASQEIYKIYRRNGDFNKVIENIKKINYYKLKYKSKYPNVIWKYILFGHNEQDVQKAKEIAKELSIPIFFDTNSDPEYSPVKNFALMKNLTGKNAQFCSPSKMLKDFLQGNSDWYYCDFLWSAPQINWDGQILGCCCNYESNFGSNVFEERLINALNNPKMIYAKNMLTGKAPKIEGIPCSNCYVYRDLIKNKEQIWLPSHKVNSKYYKIKRILLCKFRLIYEKFKNIENTIHKHLTNKNN